MHTLAELKSGALNGATELRLSEQLTVFPEEIFKLSESLIRLDLSNNQLSELPDNFGELKALKILFLSENQFEVFPKVLADCPNLEMIGFKNNRIHTLPKGALPKQTRWLILTDNHLETLPDDFAELPRMQKLMLAGNKLKELPPSLESCHQLELIRLSGNKLTKLPECLLQLPRLSWLAFSGNPFSCFPNDTVDGIKVLTRDHFELSDLLGQGASGVIYRAKPQGSSGLMPIKELAVKLFKGNITSDGYPEDELKATVRAGQHKHLVGLVARIEDLEQQGLVMELIPDCYQNLGLPPSLKSCTRDQFPSGFSLTPEHVVKLSVAMCDVLSHLHDQGVCHGDLYAHNTLFTYEGDMLFGDFGAASPLEVLSPIEQQKVRQFEIRALGCFIDDLTGVCDWQGSTQLQDDLNTLIQECLHPVSDERPTLAEIKSRLELTGSGCKYSLS